MRKDSRFEAYAILFILETAFLFWFSLLHFVEPISVPVLRLGDLEHFLAYGLYGFLGSRVARYYVKGWKVFLFGLVVGVAVGGITEGLQYFVPGRTGDAMDWAVDAIGSLAGAAAAFRFKTLSSNR